LITEFSIFLQRPVDDVFQFGWYVGIQPHDRNRCPVQDRIENRCCTFSTEGQLPSSHLIEDGSKREQIAPRIQFLCPRLLRRHISNGAERRTGTSQMLPVHRLRVKRSNFARRTACQTDLRQTEVENFGVTALRHEYARKATRAGAIARVPA